LGSPSFLLPLLFALCLLCVQINCKCSNHIPFSSLFSFWVSLLASIMVESLHYFRNCDGSLSSACLYLLLEIDEVSGEVIVGSHIRPCCWWWVTYSGKRMSVLLQWMPLNSPHWLELISLFVSGFPA
jgi:hypothetical protein